MGKILNLFNRAFPKVPLITPIQKERQLHLDRWQPTENEKPALVAYFREHYEGTLELCGHGEESAEAKRLYERVLDNPLWATKDDIQEHFADMFSCVGGDIEYYYSESPECVRLINLTVSPDDKGGITT